MTDTLTPLADASGQELVNWAMRVRLARQQPKTIKCTVGQAETLAALSSSVQPEIRFGMDASVLGLPIEWVTDPTESTFFAGRTMAAMDTGLRKIAAYATVPKELLGPARPSAEEIARHRLERQQLHAREDARHAQLLAAGGVVAAVAGLHSPEGHRECAGCDGATECPPDWPCRTWELLDETVPR